MTIPARYSGMCPDCGERWQPGDLIRTDQLNDVGLALWTHATCPDVPDISAVRPGEVICTDCWLIHPKGECDR